jgi:vacuolar protein sorting-associated protein 45
VVDQVSAVESTLSLAKLQVFQTEVIKATRGERMDHVKAVVWVRPTQENIDLLEKELQAPKFGEYHIAFSNRCPSELLHKIACADRVSAPLLGSYVRRAPDVDTGSTMTSAVFLQFEIVQNIGECYADYVALSPELFTLNVHGSVSERGSPRHGDGQLKDGLRSVLLSLKKRPVVRYSGRSSAAKQLAQAVCRDISGSDQMYCSDSSEQFEEADAMRASRGVSPPVRLARCNCIVR